MTYRRRSVLPEIACEFRRLRDLLDDVVDAEAGQPARRSAAPFAQQQRSGATPPEVAVRRLSCPGMQHDRP